MIRRLLLALFAAAVLAIPSLGSTASAPVALPKPDLEGRLTLERALATRRSLREFAPGELTLAELGQLMWAAQGVTSPEGKRTAPSARAVYPLAVYVVANDVAGLAAGLYRYEPKGHSLAAVASGDQRAGLAAATSRQAFVAGAPLVVIVTGDSALAAEKFGPRAERWVAMETGFVVQNVYLEATALGLGTVMVGGFDIAALRRGLALAAGHEPYAVLPVGRRP
jgi:SagB-type dehydrogenase family enzyme